MNHPRFFRAVLGAALLTALPIVPAVAQAQVVPVEAKASHEFIFKTKTKVKSVTVTGAFNLWDKKANPMTLDADGLTWRLKLPLAFGKVLYKFVVDDTYWTFDPTAPIESDRNNNFNSVLLLLPPDYAVPASSNDGIIARSGLLHFQKSPYFVYDRGQLKLSLRVRRNDVREVTLLSSGQRFPMELVNDDELYATYEVTIPWNRKSDLSYVFDLLDASTHRQFGANGLGVKARPFRVSAKTFVPFEVPDWVEKTVFYQIFPDRFENGDKSNDPRNVQPWDVAPNGFSRLGGDVAGVRQHLGYLKDLGINGVYFNPVFKSPSNHRYDAEDYKTLDPEFGTNAEFSALTKDLQRQGTRTVMDFVFNHTATTFAPFMDIRQKGEASAYKDWYFIKSYPVQVQKNPNYVAWYNYPSMPKLNLLNPPTRDYMLGLVDYWKKQVPLAGLRLDVANEVDPRFWRALRERVKKLDTRMWIVGEVWGDGSPWLGGDQWDSVMNYQFRDACLHYFANGDTSTSQFADHLMRVYNSYAPQVSRNMMNLLSSHDTPRFLTLCNNDVALHKLAATVQMTWVGAPSIYYGEEIGMEGGADPDNRRGMRWDMAKPDNEMLKFYRDLIRLRLSSRALQSGTPIILAVDNEKKILIYARTTAQETAIVAINRSERKQTYSVSVSNRPTLTIAMANGMVDPHGSMGFQLEPFSAQIRISKRKVPLEKAF